MERSIQGRLLAIDPGTTHSAFVDMTINNQRPRKIGKIRNETLLDMIQGGVFNGREFVVEMVSSYGKPVGSEVFDTCVWIGRFIQAAETAGLIMTRPIITRRAVKRSLGVGNGTDADVIAYLGGRYAPGQPNHGKGTKDRRGWFYGFAADIWQAYALGVAWTDIEKGGRK